MPDGFYLQVHPDSDGSGGPTTSTPRTSDPHPGKPEAEEHALKQELRSLLIWTPLRKTEFHSEAFTQIVKNLFLGGTTLVHHNPQHLRNGVPKERVVLFSFDELLKNLIIGKANKCLE